MRSSIRINNELFEAVIGRENYNSANLFFENKFYDILILRSLSLHIKNSLPEVIWKNIR